MQRLFSLAKSGEPDKFVLPLTQVSRMVPEATHKILFRLRQNYFNLLTGIFYMTLFLFCMCLETFNACDGGSKQPDRLINITYIFLNVSQISVACEELFSSIDEISTLSSFISNTKSITSFKCIVAKILLNISYHRGSKIFSNYSNGDLEMHPILINDQFIADLVSPFADEDYDLSIEEMDKLPLQLQYVDYKHSTCLTLLDTLVEVMASVSCVFIRLTIFSSYVLRKTEE
jgi:hypothetical protein